MEITQHLIFFADIENFFSYADFSKNENNDPPYVIVARQTTERANKRPALQPCFQLSARYEMVKENRF
jgi:hypothetical protein